MILQIFFILVHWLLAFYQGKKLAILSSTGPTSFAPIIETAIGIVDDSGGQYHVLLIIADGQVSYLHLESS